MDDEQVLAAMADLMRTTEEGLRTQMNLSDDWTMRDLPWMKQEYMTQLTDIIGDGNFKFVSGGSRNDWGEPGEVYSRATLFINKDGRENIKAYAEEVRT